MKVTNRTVVWAVVVLGGACTRAPIDIVGRWQLKEPNYSSTYEFRKDLTFVAEGKGTRGKFSARSRIEGSYRLVGDKLALHAIKAFSASGNGPLKERSPKPDPLFYSGDWIYTITTEGRSKLILVLDDEPEKAHTFHRVEVGPNPR